MSFLIGVLITAGLSLTIASQFSITNGRAPSVDTIISAITLKIHALYDSLLVDIKFLTDSPYTVIEVMAQIRYHILKSKHHYTLHSKCYHTLKYKHQFPYSYQKYIHDLEQFS